MTLADTVRTGGRRESLEALRDTIATAIDTAAGQVSRLPDDVDGEKAAAVALGQIATLAKQLRDTLRELAALEPPDADSPLDKIKASRSVRQSGAPVPPRPAGKDVGRSGGDRPGGERRPAARAAPTKRPARSPRRKT